MRPERMEALREALLDIAKKQLAADDPPEMRQTLDRLMQSGCTHDEAMALIGRVVYAEAGFMFMSLGDFDMERYVANLKRLPLDPVDLVDQEEED
jgi:hypothetical protein